MSPLGFEPGIASKKEQILNYWTTSEYVPNKD